MKFLGEFHEERQTSQANSIFEELWLVHNTTLNVKHGYNMFPPSKRLLQRRWASFSNSLNTVIVDLHWGLYPRHVCYDDEQTQFYAIRGQNNVPESLVVRRFYRSIAEKDLLCERSCGGGVDAVP